MRAALSALLLVSLALPAATPGIAAVGTAGVPQLNLSAEERAWLAAHPVVRIGVDAGYAPYAWLDANGRFLGVSAEFIQRISKLLGIRFEVAHGLSWTQILEAAKDKRIDLITTAVLLPERETYLAFSNIYIPTPLVIMTRDETERIVSNADLAGKRVVLVSNYSSSEQVLARNPKIVPQYVGTPLEGLRTVATGAADVYVGVLGVSAHLASHQGLNNLKINAAFDLDENGQRFAVRKDWAPLARILDKALAAMPDEDKQDIFQKWVPLGADRLYVLGSGASKAERAWIDTHPVIRVGVERHDAPFSFIDSAGQHAGIAADYLARFQDATGIKLDTVAADDADTLRQLLHRGAIDLIAVDRSSGTARPGLSRAYHHSSLMVFKALRDNFYGNVSELFNRTVAVRRGGFAEAHLSNFSAIRLLLTDRLEDALAAVANGQAIAAVTESARALKHLGVYPDTRISPAVPLSGGDTGLRFLARPDWPELVNLLDVAIVGATPEEKSLMLRKWISEPESGTASTSALLWALGATALVATGYFLILLWNAQLRRELKRRSGALVDSEARLNRTVEIARLGDWSLELASGNITWSDQLFNIAGRSPCNLDWATLRQWVHPDARVAHDEYLAQLAALPKGESIAPLISHMQRPDGSSCWLEITCKVEYDAQKRPQRFYGTAQDVTARIELERALHAQLDELNRWQEVMLEREERILDIKAEINALLAEHGQPPRYTSQT